MTFAYICIPAFNEERTIGVLLWKIRHVMADYGRDYQLLVMDDASTDATAEILERYSRVLPLRVHRHEERAGYARSLELLLEEAVRRSSYPKRDSVITIQGDFTEEPEGIPLLLKRIEGGADVVSGVSNGAAGPLARRWTDGALSWLVRRQEWPEPVTDPLSGFRAYRVISLKKALDQRDGGIIMSRQGRLANAQLLRAVAPHARRVEEAGVPRRYDRLQRRTRFQLFGAVRECASLLGSRGRIEPASGNGAGSLSHSAGR